MFEDDVRQLLGMPQPVETKIMSDTSLEKPKPHHSNISRQMDDRGGLQGSKDEQEGSQIGRLLFASRRLIIAVLLVGLLALGIVMMVEAQHRASRRQLEISYKTRGFHPRRGAGKLAASSSSASAAASLGSVHTHPDADAEVVTKDNWRSLQDKADRYRSMREASGSPAAGARGRPHGEHATLQVTCPISLRHVLYHPTSRALSPYITCSVDVVLVSPYGTCPLTRACSTVQPRGTASARY